MAKKSNKTIMGLSSHTMVLVFGIAFAVVGVYLTFQSYAAPRSKGGTIEITSSPVMHGETTTATISPAGADNYVFVQCYSPDLNGKYVYAAYFSASSAQVTMGPLAATTWKNSDGTCTADLGYFTRNGFGRWVSLAKTSFNVKAN